MLMPTICLHIRSAVCLHMGAMHATTCAAGLPCWAACTPPHPLTLHYLHVIPCVVCRTPVCAAALSHVSQRLPDAAFLAAARQLQEELQACWVAGEAQRQVAVATAAAAAQAATRQQQLLLLQELRQLQVSSCSSSSGSSYSSSCSSSYNCTTAAAPAAMPSAERLTCCLALHCLLKGVAAHDWFPALAGSPVP